MGKNELPLDLRIDLAEAFVELSWAQIAMIPPSRGGVIADHHYAVERAAHMVAIDAMLDAMLPMYDLRAIQAAGNLDAEIA